MKTAGPASAWPDVAARLAALIPRERLEPAVRAWTESPARTRRARWDVGFSGGADSLALLLLLWAHWPERRATLRALHFDHRLRGAESRADAAFCRRVCRSLGVECLDDTWREAHTDASEAEARAARLAFFTRHARVLWLGHQQDDIAETMLMRLARGSGTAGLAAPRPVHVVTGGRVHLRPLLTRKKSELVAALRAAGVSWREDGSNAGGYYFRNRVRHDVLPAWSEAAQRDALAGAAHARELLEEDDTALEKWLDSLSPFRADGSLSLRRLAGKPRALVRRALHHWLLAQPRAGGLSRQGFEALLAAVEQGTPTRHSLGREGFAVIRGRALRFAPVGK